MNYCDSMLYPNCSEIVFRLGEDTGEVQTDMYPNGALRQMLAIAEEYGYLPPLEILDNIGGGGHAEYIESVYQVAEAVVNGIITKEEGYKLEECIWCDDLYGEKLEAVLSDKRLLRTYMNKQY